MKPAQIAILVSAGAAAILLALVVNNMMSPKPAPVATAKVEAPPVTARVLTTAMALPVGTRLTKDHLVWKDLPISDIAPDYITEKPVTVKTSGVIDEAKPLDETTSAAAQATTDLLGITGTVDEFIGATVRDPFKAGEALVAAKIVRVNEGGYLAAVLRPGMRAMAVGVNVENGAGGFILPGDTVDILVTRDWGENRRSVETALRNIRVLAVDQSVQPTPEQTAVVGATATFEVSPEDVEALSLARSQGTLSLVLRAYADRDQPSGRVATQRDVQTVRVFRNGQPSEVTVNR